MLFASAKVTGSDRSAASISATSFVRHCGVLQRRLKSARREIAVVSLPAKLCVELEATVGYGWVLTCGW